MKRVAPILLLTALAGGAFAAPDRSSLDQFDAKLHARIAKQRGNYVFSPTSIAIALSMMRDGARGTTATELDAALGATSGTEARALLASLLEPPARKPRPGEAQPPQLAIATRVFGDKTLAFEQPYLDLTRDRYRAELARTDFSKPEAARTQINTWVEQQTNQRIKNLLPPRSVDEATRLVLVNAVYLKASWATPFLPFATKPAPFAVLGAGKPSVPTMHGDVTAMLGEHKGFRTLDLPYAAAGGPELAMMFVVPTTSSLSAVEQTYAKAGLKPLLAATTRQGLVKVSLPKFTYGSDIDLEPSLRALGIKTAFDGKRADFTDIAKETTPLAAAVHKAWIQVDETGTEAAAATGMGEGGAPQPIASFAVDRSFLFFIHDRDGNVLFAGRVIDPRS